MRQCKFQNGSLVLDAYILSNGQYVFQGASTCIDCGLSDLEHAARYIRNNVPPKWVEDINKGIGRPALYLYEPGLYYLLTHTTNPDCFYFRDWVFEEVLPNIRKQGFHIDSESILADRSKLEALERQTESLRNQLEIAEGLNYQMREYIDSELGKAKQKAADVATEKVTSEVKVEYQCYTDAVDGNPVVYAAEMKRQRDEAIADKRKIVANHAYLADEVRLLITKQLEHKFQMQIKQETLSVPKEETLQVPNQSIPEQTTAPIKKTTTRKKKTKNLEFLGNKLTNS